MESDTQQPARYYLLYPCMLCSGTVYLLQRCLPSLLVSALHKGGSMGFEQGIDSYTYHLHQGRFFLASTHFAADKSQD